MISISKATLFAVIVATLAGCQSMKMQPYSPAPEGVSISGSESSGYRVDSVTIQRNNIEASPEALEFCFGENIPGLTGTPLLNPSQTRMTAQGSDQVSFIVPMTMGTPLNFDLFFSVTSEIAPNTLTFNFKNLKIKGTWTNNENPLPGSQEASSYVDGSLEKLKEISTNVAECARQES